VIDTPQVRADVMAAVLTTRATAQGSSDQVCCGAMGRAEVLAVAGSRLATPQLNTEARELASATLAGAERRGAFRLASGSGSESYAPGFFQGLSGIGYQLLRLTRPELPSVLLFQADH
jgi:lantibiotic modifying enzyme